jgi:hypothetical protein
MSVLGVVRVGTAAAQAAIDAVEQFGADGETLVLRLGVVQLLHVQEENMTAEGEDVQLLDAYRKWIDVALRYYGPEPDADLPEYVRTSAMLSAELQIADLRPRSSGDGSTAAPVASVDTTTSPPPPG